MPQLSDELQAILDDATARGCLVAGHPDLKPKIVEVGPPQIVAVRSVHQPKPTKGDWRTDKAAARTGYSNPIDDPEWLEKHGFKW